MKYIHSISFLVLFFLIQGCAEDPQPETDNLFGRWEFIQADPEDNAFQLVMYYEMKGDFTLEEGMLRRNPQTDLEAYYFFATSEYATKNGFLEFNSYTSFSNNNSSGNLEYVPKDQLLQNGQPISRKMSYQLLENNTVLSVYQGCPNDICFDIDYVKQ
jgi:hypothetical protein